VRLIEVVGMLFGDEGKGSVVSALCSREPGRKLVVRASGGPQAAHHVVVPQKDTIHRCSQLGSGVFHGADTFIGGEAVVNLEDLAAEAETVCAHLGVSRLSSKLYLDWHVPVVLAIQVTASQIEAKRTEHGSCGRGVGLCFTKAYRNSDPSYTTVSSNRHNLILERLQQSVEVVFGLPNFHEYDLVVSECGQGTLLDRDFGFAPHAAWTSQRAFAALCAQHSLGKIFRLGVVRAYATRHGVGPLPHEIPEREVPAAWLDHNNKPSEPYLQGAMRYGWHDSWLMQYSQQCHPVDGLFVNHMDAVESLNRLFGATKGESDATNAIRAFHKIARQVHLATNEAARWELQKQLTTAAAGLDATTEFAAPDCATALPELLAGDLNIDRRLVGIGRGPGDKHKHFTPELRDRLNLV
jgi:adenylosuccinate synthase